MSFVGKNSIKMEKQEFDRMEAEELIKAAVINVDVVDKEILEIDNCYRHNCGFKYINKKRTAGKPPSFFLRGILSHSAWIF